MKDGGRRVPSQSEKNGFCRASEDFNCACPDSQKNPPADTLETLLMSKAFLVQTYFYLAAPMGCMILSNEDIKRLLKKGHMEIDPMPKEESIGPAGVDLTLDGKFWVFKEEYAGKTVDLSRVGFKDAMKEIRQKSITLEPGEMCLGITKERIRLPADIMGSLEGRSRYARMGLAVHITSALVQPGSDNHQVLEIVNFAPFAISIKEGMRISQVVFERLESRSSKPYALFGSIAKKQ